MRLTANMFCRKLRADISFEASEIRILMLKMKNAPKKYEDEELEAIIPKDTYQAQAELAE